MCRVGVLSAFSSSSDRSPLFPSLWGGRSLWSCMSSLWNPIPLLLLRSVLGTQSAYGVMDGQMLINRVPASEPYRRKDLWRASSPTVL